VALMGRNGAGKSTTLKALMGMVEKRRGQVQFMGRDISRLEPHAIASAGLGYVPEDRRIFTDLTVLENVQMALLSADRQVFSFFARAGDHRRDDALALLAQVGMAEQAERPCSELAYGDVKRVELAVAMAHAPKLLLMDEPTAGMAPKERNELMELTKRLVVERRMAVLFTEHSMDVVFAHADRVIVLARGRLIAGGKPSEIRDHPQVQEVYLGTGKTFERQSA
ncbi:MAG: ABC transporter ATP-binding protein, partial [Rubrivivax sp.]